MFQGISVSGINVPINHCAASYLETIVQGQLKARSETWSGAEWSCTPLITLASFSIPASSLLSLLLTSRLASTSVLRDLRWLIRPAWVVQLRGTRCLTGNHIGCAGLSLRGAEFPPPISPSLCLLPTRGFEIPESGGVHFPTSVPLL